MTVRVHAVVRDEACARVAEAVNLPAYIKLAGAGFDSARARAAILSDVCEAVIAALYLDGGMATARAFIARYWAEMFDDPGQGAEMRDAKTRLQEWLQAKGLRLPVYETVAESGMDHDKWFKVRVSCSEGFGEGEGRSKQIAGLAAADELMKKLES